jgi:uncharacterized protein
MPVLHSNMADVESPSVIAASASTDAGETTRRAPEAGHDPVVRSLDPRLVALDRTINASVGAVISAVHLLLCLILWLTAAWPRWAVLLLAVSWVPMTTGLVWLAIRWPQVDYRHRGYLVDAHGIEIRSGVVWRQVVAIPRSRVQHIDLSQGPLERSYGLATLSIHTAGTRYSRVDLPGLDHAVARELRDALLPQDAEPAV